MIRPLPDDLRAAHVASLRALHRIEDELAELHAQLVDLKPRSRQSARQLHTVAPAWYLNRPDPLLSQIGGKRAAPRYLTLFRSA